MLAMQEARACETQIGASRGRTVADHFLYESDSIAVAFQGGFWVGELTGLCEKSGY